MKRDIYIVGTSGLAKEVAQLIHKINEKRPTWNFKGYVAENTELIGLELKYGKVICTDLHFLSDAPEAAVVLGIGNPIIRKKVGTKYFEQNGKLSFPNLIHPNAHFDNLNVKIGVGNIITTGCVFTTDIIVGDFNLFNLNVTVGHDADIGNYNVINPSVNISGNVKIGTANLLGTGCQIIEKKIISDNCIIGAGAVVTKNIDFGKTVAGVPAKELNISTSGVKNNEL